MTISWRFLVVATLCGSATFFAVWFGFGGASDFSGEISDWSVIPAVVGGAVSVALGWWAELSL